MFIRRLPILLLLSLLILVAACSPLTSEIGPGQNEPTIQVSTAVPATVEPTPTAEIVVEPTPTIEVVEPAPTEEVEPTEEVVLYPTPALCPDFPRPALVLFIAEAYHLFDPATGDLCELPFGNNVVGGMLATAGDYFFVNKNTFGGEGAATIIQRISTGGTVEDLPYTAVDTEHGSTMTSFIISADAQLIAWNTLSAAARSDFPGSSISIVNLETGEPLTGVGSEAPSLHAFQPIRFSEDGSILYYAIQPYGIGGAWSSFVGRYDNLYALSTDGSAAPKLIFDCADIGTGLCIGDFFLNGNTVNALAYVDRTANAVVVLNGEGTVLNTFNSEEGYIGYPIFGPGGEFAYYTTNLKDDDPNGPPTPAMGLLHRAAPPTAPAEILVSDPGALLPVRFLNDAQIVVQWLAENGSWGLALVGVDGSVQVFDLPEGASLIDVAAVSAVVGPS